MIVSVYSLNTTSNYYVPYADIENSDFDLYHFTTSLDHFSPLSKNNKQFTLRYWVNSKYFNSAKGNIMLYICGEWSAYPPLDTPFPLYIAAELDSLIIVLEHRYYGES
jgi:hypothetical protein